MFIAVFLCAVWLSVPAHGRAWEVRRLRTSDADKAGHYPAWTVRIVPAEEDAVSVEIAEEDGPARGVILVGTRFTVPPDRLAALDFRYTTSCSLEHRSGHLGAAVYTVDAWDALSSSPTTRQMEGGNGVPRPLWSWNIHSMSQPDVTEPAPVPDAVSRAMRAILRSQAGRKLVLAVTWMGAHTAVETAALHNLKIEMEELEEPMEQLLKRLDLEADGMEKVAQAIHAGDTEAAVDALIAHFHERFPKTPETSGVSRATTRDLDEALDNRFRSVGSDEYYELRTDFDWDRNAIDDKEWLLHLQWHHIIRALLQAGVVHDDPRYTAKAVELVRDWIPRNVPGSPWSWRTLEVSLRAINWTQMFPYLLHSVGFTREDIVLYLNVLADHLDFLLPPERFHSGHNFGATESKALLTVGLAMPEFANAQTWRDTGWHRFEHEITAQVLEDGAQKELTTGYHVGVLNSFFSAAQQIKGTGMTPSDLYWKRLEKMHDYVMFLTKPDGGQPNLGDSWKGRHAETLVRGAEFFDRPDMLFVGTNGVLGTPPAFLDTQLPAAGYYVMRTAWTDDPQGIYVMLDAARHWGGWHQHYDALGLILYAYGDTLTPDAGPFAYGSPLRDVFQSTAAHSTVCVDESNQNTSPCVLHESHTGEAFSFLDASQNGYADVTHRRQVLFTRPADGVIPYVLVVDRLTGEGSHTLDQHFHLLPAEVDVNTREAKVVTRRAEGANLIVQGLARKGIELNGLESWITATYGKKRARPDVRFRREGELPALFVTLLVPYSGPREPEVHAELSGAPQAGGAVCAAVRGPWGTDRLVLAPEPMRADADGVSVDGRVALIRYDRNGDLQRQEILAD